MADPQITAPMPSGRDGSGRFTPGNPFTRRGSKNKVSRDALTAVQGLSSLAILRLRERIEAGDMQAIRLTLEYTLPRGGRTIELDSANPLEWADALAHGEVSPAEAATASQALAKLTEIAELDELRKRIDELEGVLADRSK